MIAKTPLLFLSVDAPIAADGELPMSGGRRHRRRWRVRGVRLERRTSWQQQKMAD